MHYRRICQPPRLLIALVLALLTSAAAAQQWRWRSTPVREGMPDRRGGFMFCRLRYTSVVREANGQGWSTDYPSADNNFMSRLAELTHAPIATWNNGEPGYVVVDATDPALFQCPFLFASDVGTAGFSQAEARQLRAYLQKGGFLWVDDFWGNRAWARWVGEILAVLPNAQIVDIPRDHAIFNTLYAVPETPQIPSIQFWRRSGGGTSERGSESAEPHLRGIFDDRGRLMVLMSHNTDIADGWEREGEDDRFFYAFSPGSYAIGINVVIWAMTR